MTLSIVCFSRMVSLRWIHDRGYPIRDKGGAFRFRVGVATDITVRKQMDESLRHHSEELTAANAELARAGALKDEFLASMSHELRTPLNGILGLSEALQEHVCGPVNDGQAEALRDIEHCGRHLLRLINDILDLSKIGAGKLQLELAPSSVDVLCEASLRMVKQNAQAKQQRMSSSIDGAIGRILADERRLKQALVNLLSNAVKFTPEGGSIGLDVSGDPARRTVSFTVSDTGIGIRQEDMGLLFEPFQQIDSRLSRQYAGTGLGLALVRKISELHGGSVSVTSEPGKGSRFTVTIPWEEAVEPAKAMTDLDPQPRIRKVLLIEDSSASVEVLNRYLREMGVQTIVQSCGTGALERVRQEKPDVVFLDLLLPDAVGWELLSAFKSDLELCKIPILVISDLDERVRGLSLGAAEYLVKPVTRQQLQWALMGLTTRKSELGPPPPDPSEDSPLEGPLLLLAEDNEIGASLLANYLRQAGGYRVARALDGHEAIRLARELSPQLILMDIQMPGMDGLEATRQLRADPQTCKMPIIAVTALAMADDEERCLGAGADAYLSKPLSLRELLRIVKETLRRSSRFDFDSDHGGLA